jgi:hypothetical protein
MACMTKLRAADTVIGGTHLDVVLSMVQSGVSLEIVPTALGLGEDFAHMNRRVESGHGKQGK